MSATRRQVHGRDFSSHSDVVIVMFGAPALPTRLRAGSAGGGGAPRKRRKIAFPIAGATAVVAGSPSPTGASVLGRNSTSISGTSAIRSNR